MELNSRSKGEANSSARSKCQFCFAFYSDPTVNKQHIDKCNFRFSETFIAFSNRIKFACTVCRDVFDSRKELESHEERHLLPGGFKCSSCQKVYQNEVDLQQHEQIAHNKFECLLCSTTQFSGDKRRLTNHCKKSHQSKNGRYAHCLDCGANFEQKSYLRLHKETKCGRLRGWNCFECSPMLASRDAYNEHLKTHVATARESENNEFFQIKTEIVNVPINESVELMEPNPDYNEDPILLAMKHEDQLHPEPNTDDAEAYASERFGEHIEIQNLQNESFLKSDEDCNYEMELGDDNRDECEDNDRDDSKSMRKPYECGICGTGFMVETIYNKHIAIHGPDGSWIVKCTFCRLHFATAEEMEKHRDESHVDAMKCIHCDKTYNTQRKMKRHMLGVHNARSTYECSQCGFKIGNKRHFILHITNCATRRAFLFKCKICDATFDSEEKMKMHGFEHENASDDEENEPNEDYERIRNQMELHQDKHTFNEIEITPKNENFATAEQSEDQRRTVDEMDYEDGNNDDEEDERKNNDDEEVERKNNDGENSESMRQPFECGVCSVVFTQKFAYLKHIDLHGRHGNLVVKCTLCNQLFVSIKSMQKHRKQKHSDKLKCAYCMKTFNSDSTKRRHIRDVHNSESKRFAYECDKCGFKTGDKKVLNSHIAENCERVFLFSCKLCDSAFETLRKLQTHKLKHGNTCDICNREFETQRNLINHRRVHKNGEKEAKYICSKCSAEFILETSLEDHELSDCNRNPFYSCNVCNARFVGRHPFRRHMEGHEGVQRKTFQCEICERVLKSKHALQHHLNIHTGVKPYKCSYCGKAFRFEGTHKAHELAHKGVKEYECPGCMHRFTCNSNLHQHRRIRKDTCGLIPLQSLRVLKSSQKTVKKK